MELLVIVIFILMSNEKRMGKYLNRVKYWQEFYSLRNDDDLYWMVVRQRAINIRGIRRAKLKAQTAKNHAEFEAMP